jgi:hypothetical protein
VTVKTVRRIYGTDPLHLLALIASFAIAAFAVVGWFGRPADAGAVLVWFASAIVAHDLVLLPLYSLLDMIAFGRRRRRAGATPTSRAPAVSAIPYLRIPALLSGLLLLVFFPQIFELGSSAFHTASGLGQGGYLARWLAATGALFAASGIAYARALRRAAATRPLTPRREAGTARTPPSPPQSPPSP